MYIGQLSRLTGASCKAIRHYESLNLLGPVARRGSYRVYGEQHRQRVLLIRQALRLEFRLADLVPIMSCDDDCSEPDWHGLVALLDQRRSQVRAEMSRLRQLEDELSGVHQDVTRCLGHPDPDVSVACLG